MFRVKNNKLDNNFPEIKTTVSKSIEDYPSEQVKVVSDVPQGSDLELLPFLILTFRILWEQHTVMLSAKINTRVTNTKMQTKLSVHTGRKEKHESNDDKLKR